MARIIEELYCQVDGKVYVSRDFEKDYGRCVGCAFDHSTGCVKLEKSGKFICVLGRFIWKELKGDD